MTMKVGDLISRKQRMKTLNKGVIIGFDKDGDPVILWSSGVIEEEFARQVEVISSNEACKR